MNKPHRFILILLAALPLTACATPPPNEPIFEDDPRWDCHTMGNRICGEGKG